MSKLKCFSYFIFFLIFLVPKSFSENNVYFIDLDQIIQNSELGKKTLNNINSQNDKNLTILKKKESELREQDEEINKKKNILSKDELDAKISNLRKNVELFNREKDNLVNNFKKYKNDNLENFFKKINPIIQKYMKDNSISLLLDRKNVFIGNVDSDITNDIINLINEEFK